VPATARAPKTTSDDIGRIVEAANALTNRNASSILMVEISWRYPVSNPLPGVRSGRS
jgi:hypothetical protein